MLLDYETITRVLTYEFLARQCGAVEALHERKSWSAEYGISWEDFLNEYQSECVPPSRIGLRMSPRRRSSDG